MDDMDHNLAPPRVSTPRRPLLGLTVLVIEDSRFTCEAVRLMSLRSGARIRRADCLRSARRHLQVYRPSVVIVDLGLPDGSGLDLIEDLDRTDPRVGVILGTSGEDHVRATVMAAGADGFLAKPLDSLLAFQHAILDAMPAGWQPSGPRKLKDQTITPDPVAIRDDMSHAASLLDDHQNGPALDYLARFLRGVARSADDSKLLEAASDLAECRACGRSSQAPLARVAGLVQDRLHETAAI